MISDKHKEYKTIMKDVISQFDSLYGDHVNLVENHESIKRKYKRLKKGTSDLEDEHQSALNEIDRLRHELEKLKPGITKSMKSYSPMSRSRAIDRESSPDS